MIFVKRYVVEFSKFASKQADKLPKTIKEALYLWKASVVCFGLNEVRKSKGYHDEPLRGVRKGQRSVRLNRSYRLIYDQVDRGAVVVVGIQEINKHEY